MNPIRKFYRKLVSIGITDELSFSDKLRIELNNLFLGIVLPFAIFYLVYNTLGPRLSVSYIVTVSWVLIMLVPLYLNYQEKYTAAKLYSIIVPLLAIVVVHLLHGWGMRIETAYLLLILLSSFFFKRQLAVIMSVFVGLVYCVVAILLLYIQPPLANKLLPMVPLVYFAFVIVSSIILVTRVLAENENFNLLTATQNNTLDEKNKQLEKFTYIASHDLKTPIRNITSFAGLLERDVKKNKHEHLSEHLSYIKSSALQMSTLVEDVLQIATLDYADQEVRSLVKLDQIIEQVKQTLKNEILAINAIIQAESLPDYYGSESEFYLVFQNLIQNGIKYNKSKVPKIEIWATKTKNQLQIHLADNGIGIEEAYHEQIFEFFKRLHPSSEYEGTGLGLGLCKRIMESYEGSISLQSTPNQGSIFTINLPLNQ